MAEFCAALALSLTSQGHDKTTISTSVENTYFNTSFQYFYIFSTKNITHASQPQQKKLWN